MAQPDYIGPYRVDEEIGRGGLGVVYRGWDERLMRSVAIKILEGTRDADRDARFVREARSLATLDHTGIAVVYGIEETSDGGTALVMEFVEGQDLSERLREGPLSLEETIAVGDEVAAALEAAHARGLVHRDLKPANVRIRADGRVKLLDFGLARLVGSPPLQRESGGPVGAPESTVAGRILGTPGYMAPEQILGQPIDARSDVFAFGCVLYECLTGRRAFDGEDVTARLQRTLTFAPDLGELPAATPDPLRRVLRRCLEKSRHLRASDVTWIRGTFAALRSDRPRRHAELPRPLTRFIGRDGERQTLRALVAARRVVTVTGVGGTGKTRLAIETARDIVASGDVFSANFVDLSHTTRTLSVAVEIARALGAADVAASSVEDATSSSVTAVSTRIGNTPTLLILDNCEQAAAAVRSVLRDLLPRAHGLQVLSTSRVPLNAPGEQVLPLGPLPVSPSSRAPMTPPAEAERLFFDRALLVKPHLSIDEDARRHAADLCRRVDGIPLAIELIARRVRSTSLEDLRHTLETHMGLVLDESAPDDDRARTLRAAVEWSVERLPDRARTLFERLAVFPGGVTLESGVAVCDVGTEIDALEALSALVDAGIVYTRADPTGRMRYDMLTPIRIVAGDHLVASEGSDKAWRARHAAHVLSFVRALRIDEGDPRRAVDLDRLEAEHVNVVTAFASEDATVEDLLEAFVVLQSYWSARGFGRAALDVFETIDARAATDTRVVGSPRRADALLVAAELANQRGLVASARAYVTEALRIRRAGSDERLVASAELALGGVDYRERHYDDARAALERARDIAERQEDDTLRARVLNAFGGIAWASGDLAEAATCYRKCAEVHRRKGNTGGEALALANLANVLHGMERYDESIAFAERALTAYGRLSDRWGTARTLPLLGLAQFRSGRGAAGARAVVRAFEELDALGGEPDLAGVLYTLAILATGAGEHTRAAEFLGASDALRDRLGIWMTEREIAELEPDIATSREALGEAFEEARTLGRSLERHELLDRARRLRASLES